MQEYRELTHKQGYRSCLRGVEGHTVFRFHSSCESPRARFTLAPSWVPRGAGQHDRRLFKTAPRDFLTYVYALLSFLPPFRETPILLIGPAIGIIVLLALPVPKVRELERRPIPCSHSFDRVALGP